MAKHRVTLEFDLNFTPSTSATELAVQAMQAFMRNNMEDVDRIEGLLPGENSDDAVRRLVGNDRTVASGIAAAILQHGLQVAPWASIEKINISNDPIEGGSE